MTSRFLYWLSPSLSARFLLGLLLALPLWADTWRVFEEQIDLSGPVEGDAFLLANDVVLSGSFGEDVWAGGRKIEFTGTTADDLRVAGLEVVTVDGKIAGNLWALSSVGNIVLNTNAVVQGRAVLQAGKRISLKGEVFGDVLVEAPRVVVEGRIEGDLTVNSRNLQLLPGTRIGGDLISRKGPSIPVPAGVEVAGERRVETTQATDLSRDVWKWTLILKALQFVTSFIIGIGFLRVFPRFTGQNVDLLLQRQGPLVTIGLLGLLALSLSGYFLLFSVLGTGVGIFLLLITGLLFYLGKIFVAFLIGMLVLRQTRDLPFRKLVLGYLIGLLLLYTLTSIPYIGTTLYILASCWGMGAMMVSLRHSQQVIHLNVPPPSQPDNP